MDDADKSFPIPASSLPFAGIFLLSHILIFSLSFARAHTHTHTHTHTRPRVAANPSVNKEASTSQELQGVREAGWTRVSRSGGGCVVAAPVNLDEMKTDLGSSAVLALVQEAERRWLGHQRSTGDGGWTA